MTATLTPTTKGYKAAQAKLTATPATPDLFTPTEHKAGSDAFAHLHADVLHASWCNEMEVETGYVCTLAKGHDGNEHAAMWSNGTLCCSPWTVTPAPYAPPAPSVFAIGMWVNRVHLDLTWNLGVVTAIIPATSDCAAEVMVDVYNNDGEHVLTQHWHQSKTQPFTGKFLPWNKPPAAGTVLPEPLAYLSPYSYKVGDKVTITGRSVGGHGDVIGCTGEVSKITPKLNGKHTYAVSPGFGIFTAENLTLDASASAAGMPWSVHPEYGHEGGTGKAPLPGKGSMVLACHEAKPTAKGWMVPGMWVVRTFGTNTHPGMIAKVVKSNGTGSAKVIVQNGEPSTWGAAYCAPLLPDYFGYLAEHPHCTDWPLEKLIAEEEAIEKAMAEAHAKTAVQTFKLSHTQQSEGKPKWDELMSVVLDDYKTAIKQQCDDLVFGKFLTPTPSKDAWMGVYKECVDAKWPTLLLKFKVVPDPMKDAYTFMAVGDYSGKLYHEVTITGEVFSKAVSIAEMAQAMGF